MDYQKQVKAKRRAGETTSKEPHQPDALISIETEMFKITLDHPSYILQVKTVRNPEVISPRILMSLGWRYVKGHKPPGTWRTENLSVIRDTVKTIKGGKNNG